jgi:hypothetical protein
MQGSIEQSIGLTVAGNAFLQGRDIGRFWPDSPIFVFCRNVRFVAMGRGEAADPLDWFRSLAKDCRGLRLHAVPRRRPEMPDWMDVALVGGGSRWLIETVGCARPLLWSDEWVISDPAGRQERPWSVTYHGLPNTGIGPGLPVELDQAAQNLDASLDRILTFAERISSHFAESFEEALAILKGRKIPDRDFIATLGPDGVLAPEAERLLAACRAGWVFGGMGAWNDGGYDGKDAPEGDRLTGALFDSLQAALSAAASSTCRPVE